MSDFTFRYFVLKEAEDYSGLTPQERKRKQMKKKMMNKKKIKKKPPKTKIVVVTAYRGSKDQELDLNVEMKSLC